MKITKRQLKKIIKEQAEDVLVPGVGVMRIDQVRNIVRKNLEDLIARLDGDSYSGIGHYQFVSLEEMWNVLKDNES